MKLTIEGNEEETKKALQAINGSKEHEIKIDQDELVTSGLSNCTKKELKHLSESLTEKAAEINTLANKTNILLGRINDISR